jgi:hypothetical protein
LRSEILQVVALWHRLSGADQKDYAFTFRTLVYEFYLSFTSRIIVKYMSHACNLSLLTSRVINPGDVTCSFHGAEVEIVKRRQVMLAP